MQVSSIDATARLEKLRALMRKHGLDIVALIPGPNMRYLTDGEHYINERPIVMFVQPNEPSIAVIPQLEVPLFSRHMSKSQMFSWSDAEGYDSAFKAGMEAIHASGKVLGV